MKIKVTNRDGKKVILEGDSNSTLMEIIRDEGLDIEAACGGCCACATCHIYISEEWASKIEERNEEEESMLDQAFHTTSKSRLGCQIEFNDGFDGLKLTLAPE